MAVRALAAQLDGGALAPDPDEGIDLVALATVADAVPLVGDNRRRVAQGLRAIRERPRPGIAALCAAAGIEPRTVSAHTLGFTLAPCINAAGRLAHADRALELLLAPDRETADHRGGALELNARRREVEQEILEAAVAQHEAQPTEIREAGAIVVTGDGWHEGVVGIVAACMVERFERPAIVLARRRLSEGVGPQPRRRRPPRSGGGLGVADAVGRSRRGGGARAPGLGGRPLPRRAAGGRGRPGGDRAARVKAVDAVVGGRDLTLATAEAIEALAPFGRGNPSVRLVVPGAEPSRRPGSGRAGTCRCAALPRRPRPGRSGSAWASGRPRSTSTSATTSCSRSRWNAGRASWAARRSSRSRSLGPRDVLPAQCAQPCDARCPDRVPLADLRAMLDDDPLAVPEPPAGDAAPPLGLRDRRGGLVARRARGLAGADRGVVAVVCDIARRRPALETALEPGRLGAEVAVLAGGRCDPGRWSPASRAPGPRARDGRLRAPGRWTRPRACTWR